MHKTSQPQLDKLKGTEGFRATAYRDGSTNGTPLFSIGYGHQIQSNEAYLKTATLTKANAEALLRSDISPLETQINKVENDLSQNQFDALIDFGYNCGSGALALVLTTWVKTKSITAVTNEIKLYNKTHDNVTDKLVVSTDLSVRRQKEANLFNTKDGGIVIPSLIALAVGIAAVLAFS